MTFDIFTPDDSQTSITDRFGRTFTHTPSRPKRGTYERTAPMSETFTAGEEVTLTTQGRKVRVEFGPFTTAMCQAAYVVKFLDGNGEGHSQSVPGSALERGPKFTTGDAVKVLPLDTPGTIAAGPFQGANLVTYYVVAYPTGTHRWVSESALTKVASSSTYTLNGVTYDLTAIYNDRDGDRWTFNGRREGGVPLMDAPQAGYGYLDYPLTRVVNSFGPLTRVA